MMEQDPRSRAFHRLADALTNAGRHAEALRVCREGLQRHPRLAAGQLALERAEQAAKRSAADTSPESPLHRQGSSAAGTISSGEAFEDEDRETPLWSSIESEWEIRMGRETEEEKSDGCAGASTAESPLDVPLLPLTDPLAPAKRPTRTKPPPSAEKRSFLETDYDEAEPTAPFTRTSEEEMLEAPSTPALPSPPLVSRPGRRASRDRPAPMSDPPRDAPAPPPPRRRLLVPVALALLLLVLGTAGAVIGWMAHG